jgi:acetoin utilization deacetylase AcuC-like enzyme
VLKVFFSQNQNVHNNFSFSPSAGKPQLVVESWMKRNKPFLIEDFLPASREDLKLIHDPQYVDGVLDLKKMNGFGNRKKEVADALPWVCGSMVAATLEAWKNKSITISPTSGAHHACYAIGRDFCTFNFLVLAALKAHNSGARKLGIIDLDCHYGDGTQNIIDRLKLDFIQHYSFGADPVVRISPSSWLKNLPYTIESFSDCELILYNAGVDSHIDDPLGGYLTTEQIEERESIVINAFAKKQIPMTISLAGGYQKDVRGNISEVIELHGFMFDAAWNAEALRSIQKK